MASSITVTCPECDKQLKASSEVLGKKIRCKACGATFVGRAAKEAPAKGAPAKGASAKGAPAKGAPAKRGPPQRGPPQGGRPPRRTPGQPRRTSRPPRTMTTTT